MEKIINSSISDSLKKNLLNNLNWAIKSISLEKNKKDRENFRNLLSNEIHRINPFYIFYVKTEEEIKKITTDFYNIYSKKIHIVLPIISLGTRKNNKLSKSVEDSNKRAVFLENRSKLIRMAVCHASYSARVQLCFPKFAEHE